MTVSASVDWDGKERRQHYCIQEENIGRFKEFMNSIKGMRFTIFTIAFAIVIQVGTFLYLWGGLTEIVKKDTEHLWKDVTPLLTENTRNIDKILEKLDVQYGKSRLAQSQ